MMTKTYLIICYLFLLTLAGCGGFRAFPEAPFDMDGQLESTKFAFEPTAYTGYYNATGVQQLQLRNQIINAQIRAYDIKFSEYEQDLFEMGIGLGVGTDWASLALSGLTASVGGATLKSIFGVINAGLIGAKGAVDKHLFMEKTLPVIMTEITSQRTTVLVQIRNGLGQDVNNYSLDHGLSDIQRYARAGSIASGLNGILASSGTKLQKNQNALNKLATFNFLKDEAGDKLRSFWKPGGKVDSNNKAKLEAEMVKHGLATGAGRIANFIRGAKFAVLRMEIVNGLGL